MDKQIAIRSDRKTLEDLHKKIRKEYLNSAKAESKGVLMASILLLVFTGIALLLANWKKDIVFVAILLLLTFIFTIGYEIFQWFKRIRTIRKHNSGFKNFAKRYEGIDFVYYNLYNDYLEYDGHDKCIYKWTDFINFADYDDSFRLLTGNLERNIWIPKSVMVHVDDFDYFKSFAKERINSAMVQ